MTQARPKGANTGRLLGDQLVDSVQDEQSLGMIVLLASCTASTNVVLPARLGVSGARPASPPRSWLPRCRPLQGVYEEIRTPWRHATIHLRTPYLPSERVGPTLAVAERIS